jgi:transcriptional regulator with XRE-family HTH domain
MTPHQIRAHRVALGYTQASLGAALGVSQGHIARVERGERLLSQPALELLAQLRPVGWRQARGPYRDVERRQRREAAAAKCAARVRARPYEPAQCEGYDRVCYRTRGHALRAFLEVNQGITEPWGLFASATGGEFDSVNEKYERRGARRVTTLAEALDVALPPGRPYCLNRLDLEVLNETAPALELGPFRLPDVVDEHVAYQQYLGASYDEYAREQLAQGGDVPF